MTVAVGRWEALMTAPDIAARIAMIAITTNNSMSVKPVGLDEPVLIDHLSSQGSMRTSYRSRYRDILAVTLAASAVA